MAATWIFGVSIACEQKALVATGKAPSTEQNTLVATGQQARTGMPAIPSSPENPLEATPFGAYTNIWNIEEAAPPVPSVFATMDDETLSQLIIEYSDQMRKLKSGGLSGLLENAGSDHGFGWGDIINSGRYAADAAALQLGRFDYVTPKRIPSPGSQPGVPGTIMIDIDSGFTGKGFSTADDVFKFRLEDGEINIPGLDYMLENGDLSALEKMVYKALDGAEMPESIAKILKSSDELANATKVIKNGGTALGWIGTALDLYEVANTAYDDYYDEDPGFGKKTYDAAALTVGGWGGGWGGAKIGAMGCAATGTLICPGFGTVIGGIIGGVVGGIAGSTAGRAMGAHLFDEVYEGK